jgi:hypothetical protein
MLFWLSVVLVAIGIWLNILYERNYNGWFLGLSMSTVTIGLAGIIIVGSVAILNNVGASSEVASLRQEYDSLVYQYENNFYDNDNDVGKKELMREIQEWNSDLAFDKEIQRNFWVGICVPNIYDEFEFIELK